MARAMRRTLRYDARRAPCHLRPDTLRFDKRAATDYMPLICYDDSASRYASLPIILVTD